MRHTQLVALAALALTLSTPSCKSPASIFAAKPSSESAPANAKPGSTAAAGADANASGNDAATAAAIAAAGPAPIPEHLFETNPGGIPAPGAYTYAPAMLYDKGRFHVFYCANGDSSSWDYIKYRSSEDGRNWTGEQDALRAVSAQSSSDRSACDPSVVKFQAPGDAQPYYYLYSTGNAKEDYCEQEGNPGYHMPNKDACGQSQVFVARSTSISGPYLKYLGSGQWESAPLTSSTPAPILRRRFFSTPIVGPDNYGAGQTAVVVRDGRLMLWYYDDSGEAVHNGHIYLITSFDGVNWSAPQLSDAGLSSSDVKWDPATHRFAMYSLGRPSNGQWLDGNHEPDASVIRRWSSDGVHWGPVEVMYANRTELEYAHNLGVASDNQGWLDPHYSIVAFGARARDWQLCDSWIKRQFAGCWAQWNIDAFIKNLSPAPVSRSYNPGNGDHVYTTNPTEVPALASAGWTTESAGDFVLHRFHEAGEAAVYRLYLPSAGLHYYTANAVEREGLLQLGWTYERLEGFLFARPTPGATEVLHAYNPNGGQHFFTTNAAELGALVSAGWQHQTSLGYSPPRTP